MKAVINVINKLLVNKEEPHAISWLTLFFDLIVVAVFARASYIYGKYPSWLVFAFIVVALTLIYLIWSMTTLELLLAARETWIRRAVVFAQVCALLVSGLAMYRGGGISDRYGFAALSVAFVGVAAHVWLRSRSPEADRRFIKPLGISAGAVALIFAIGACFPMGYAIGDVLIAWIFYPLGALVAVITFSLWGPRLIVKPAALAAHALNERFGVLLLIVMGDAFLQLLEILGAKRSIANPLFLIYTLVLVAAIWMLYYPRLAEVPLTNTVAAARVRVFGHYLLALSSMFAIVAYSVSADSGSESGHIQIGAVQWTALPVTGVVGAILLLTLVRDHRWSRAATLHTVTLVLLFAVNFFADIWVVIEREQDLVIAVSIVLIDAIAVLAVTKPQPVAE